MYCSRYCIIQATTTSQFSLTSLSDSNFKSRLPDSTVNWDSHKKENRPRGMISLKTLIREGQSLKPKLLLNFVTYTTPGGGESTSLKTSNSVSTNPFHRTTACRKESRGTYQEYQSPTQIALLSYVVINQTSG